MEILSTSIANYFRKTGFVQKSLEISTDVDLKANVPVANDFEDYVNVNENLAVYENLRDAEIFRLCYEPTKQTSDEEE